MTIDSEILKLQSNLADSYTACNGKGATMPISQNFDNLPTCINSIQTGGGSFIGIPREVSNTGVYQMPTTSFTFSLPSNVIDVDNYAMYYAFYNCSVLTSIDFSSLTAVSGTQALRYAFSGCISLTSVDLSSLAVVTGSRAFANTFSSCSRLSSLSFPSLNSSSFGSSTNQFNAMLQGTPNCTVHFPSNLQSVIGSWSDVTAGFGGRNTTVLFDLPATT